ncbi:MAG: hypothetical protein WC809_11415 [Sinimarinibacterium sp.]
MFKTRGFWLSQMLVLIVFYAAAIVLSLNGLTSHVVVKVAMVLLAAHILEIPLAFYALRGRNPQALRVMIATSLFGLIWWIPAKRGLLAVK